MINPEKVDRAVRQLEDPTVEADEYEDWDIFEDSLECGCCACCGCTCWDQETPEP